MNHNIRFANIDDAENLASLERENFDEPWSVKNFEECISSPRGRVVVYETEEGELLGCVVLYYAADEGEIDSVVVKKSVRQCGIGGKMFAFLHQEVEKLGVHFVFLEVRSSNLPAQRLYEKMGYKHVGERKSFYQNPSEDAYIYKREQ